MSNFLDPHRRMGVAIPVGLPELISDIARHVLINKPKKILPYIADYLESELKARNLTKNVSNYINNVFDDVRTKLLKSYKKRGISEELAEEAATKIQAVYKGYKVRQILHEMSKRKISISADIHVNKRTSKLRQKSLNLSEDTQSIKYLKSSATSVAESSLYPLSSKLQLKMDADDGVNHLERYSSFESVKSEYNPPTKATVLTDLQLLTNNFQEEVALKSQEYIPLSRSSLISIKSNIPPTKATVSTDLPLITHDSQEETTLKSYKYYSKDLIATKFDE